MGPAGALLRLAAGDDASATMKTRHRATLCLYRCTALPANRAAMLDAGSGTVFRGLLEEHAGNVGDVTATAREMAVMAAGALARLEGVEAAGRELRGAAGSAVGAAVARWLGLRVCDNDSTRVLSVTVGRSCLSG